MEAAQARQELRQAIKDCNERRLHESAKWAAQQLAGIVDESDRSLPPPSLNDPCPCTTVVEEDALQLALCHFDFRVSMRALGLI